MDALKLRHLENILYRMDTVKERSDMLHEWTVRGEVDVDGFLVLAQQCNLEDVKRDAQRKSKGNTYGL